MSQVLSPGSSVAVQVPATSANLGPGFDAFGLALSFYDELKVTVTAEPGIRVIATGYGAEEVPKDETNLIAVAIAKVFLALNLELPGLLLETQNRIPHGSGLGSSGAAIAGGIFAAKELLAGQIEISDLQLLAWATELEGHPDNVAPALFGGFTLAWMAEGTPDFVQLAVSDQIVPVAAFPDFSVSTNSVRGLQPDKVPLQDAVYNLSRAALLTASLRDNLPTLLEATTDRLHQNYRASAMPETTKLLAELRSRGFAAVVSGAGPSVLVLAQSPAQAQESQEFISVNFPNWQALMLKIDNNGATVVPTPVA